MRTIYRLLLKLYPARFREEYARPLERQLEDDYRDSDRGAALVFFWPRARWGRILRMPRGSIAGAGW